MLFLILLANKSKKQQALSEATCFGIKFWSAMYIPIIVAMAGKQNVIAAVEGGPLAITAGVLAVLVSFALVPLIRKLDRRSSPDNAEFSVTQNRES